MLMVLVKNKGRSEKITRSGVTLRLILAPKTVNAFSHSCSFDDLDVACALLKGTATSKGMFMKRSMASQTVFSALLALSAFSGIAQAHSQCYTDCWYDRWGNRHCRTVCDNTHHHPTPPPVVVVDPDKEDLAISASILAISATTLAINDNKTVALVQVTEDAAAYLDSGKMTGALAAMLNLAREEAAKKAGVDVATQLSDAQLVDGLLQAAEQALEN